jgi:hypothetical protein
MNRATRFLTLCATLTALLFSAALAQSESDTLRTVGSAGVISDAPSVVNGRISQAGDNEPLESATVYFIELSRGVASDEDGLYEISVPLGRYTVRVQFLAYRTIETTVEVLSSGTLNFEMQETELDLDEIVVEGEGSTDLLRGSVTGVEVVQISDLAQVPVLLGEVDVIQSLVALPGVQTVGEGASGFNVRGGSVDQNLVLLDGSPIFNPSHVLGIYSVFSPDATEKFTLYKGHMPVQYGGRLSSVLDVTMKNASFNKFRFSGGLGIYAARATVEAPILKNRTSFLFSGRGSSSGVAFAMAGKNRELARLPIERDIYNSAAWFYDGYARLTHRFNNRNRLTLSAYGSDDYFRYTNRFGYSWRNLLGVATWNSELRENLFSRLSASINDYESSYFTPSGASGFLLENGIGYLKLKETLLYTGFSSASLIAGAEYTRYNSDDETAQPWNTESAFSRRSVSKDEGDELSFFIGSDIDLTPSLLASLGARHTSYRQLGPAAVLFYEDDRPAPNSTVTGRETFSAGEQIVSYSGFEPRLSLRYSLNEESSVKLSYNRTRQYIHQISNSFSATPSDIWQVSTRYIPPQEADSYSAGYYREFIKPSLQTSFELYYRSMDNVVEYRDFAELFLSEAFEQELLAGIGRAYGAEVSIEKREGKWTGWLSYTYSRSEVQIENESGVEVNNGEWYPASFDQPHQLSITGIRNIGKESAFSFQFTWRSGRPITAISASYLDRLTTVPVFSERNQYRIPDYIRLDISFTIAENIWKNRRPDPNRRIEDSANITFYNFLGRENAFSVFYQRREGAITPQSFRLSVLGAMIPSFTYNMKF